MAFNAKWLLEDLASERALPLEVLLAEFRQDLAELIREVPVLRLGLAKSGNYFRLSSAAGTEFKPRSECGLYVIFDRKAVVYFGEAGNLFRRQLQDPDNTAASNKSFRNQGRAILKLLLHKDWTQELGLEELYMQIYGESQTLTLHDNRTFEDVYALSRYSKSLEGAGALAIGALHSELIRALERQYDFGQDHKWKEL